jgi:hypothetical protein
MFKRLLVCLGLVLVLASSVAAQERGRETDDDHSQQKSKPKDFEALRVTTTTLSAAALGVPYSETLQAEGGIPPYTWKRQSGKLPAGVKLQSNGVLTGTPCTPGSFTFVVEVQDRSKTKHAVEIKNHTEENGHK